MTQANKTETSNEARPCRCDGHPVERIAGDLFRCVCGGEVEVAPEFIRYVYVGAKPLD